MPNMSTQNLSLPKECRWPSAWCMMKKDWVIERPRQKTFYEDLVKPAYSANWRIWQIGTDAQARPTGVSWGGLY